MDVSKYSYAYGSAYGYVSVHRSEQKSIQKDLEDLLKYLFDWLFKRALERIFKQTFDWLLKQTSKQGFIYTYNHLIEPLNGHLSERPNVSALSPPAFWASVQVERRLCLKRFLIVRYFPTFPQSCPTFPHFFLVENSTTVPDCYICGSRHSRLFSHWPPFQGLRTIIISVWIGTDIMNRPPLRTTFVQHSRRVPITIFSLSVRMHKRAWQGMFYHR